jgi:hypothetical protein
MHTGRWPEGEYALEMILKDQQQRQRPTQQPTFSAAMTPVVTSNPLDENSNHGDSRFIIDLGAVYSLLGDFARSVLK